MLPLISRLHIKLSQLVAGEIPTYVKQKNFVFCFFFFLFLNNYKLRLVAVEWLYRTSEIVTRSDLYLCIKKCE